MKFLVIDNYDSFTYNLVHYLEIAGAKTHTIFNDDPFLEEIDKHLTEYQGVVLSPGPCTPEKSGQLMHFIAQYCDKIPLLGVCLGMQALGEFFGWELRHAKLPMHGKTSEIVHAHHPLFNDIANPMTVARYHSLILIPKENSVLETIAYCGEEVMALAHKELPIWGVQFHPESILTPQGMQLIRNFTEMCARYNLK